VTREFVWTVASKGWYGPTPGLLEEMGVYDQAGLARTGSPHLYRPALEVPENAPLPRIATIGEGKLRACINPENKTRVSGVGIAFSQLAMASTKNYRIFAMLTGLPDLKRASTSQGKVVVYRNASYTPIESAGRSKKLERCLSAPGLWAELWRWNEIRVQYTGQSKPLRLTGVDAWIFQHESDHTDGILCHDRALEIYFAPTEFVDEFYKDEPRNWKYKVAPDFWKALKSGVFDFTKPPHS
jgi:peptide deformylase